MKQASNYIILGLFAIGGITIWLITGQATMLAFSLFVIIIASIIWWSELKNRKEPIPEETPTIDNLIEKYGQPDDIIVTDPTHAEEPQGAILVYHDTLVYDQMEIPKADIVDLTFNNAMIPYLPADYQVIITTKDKNQPLVRIHTGNDANWAQEVVVAIKNACTTASSIESKKSE